MSLLSLKCIYQHYQKLLLCTAEIGLVLALASGLFFQNCNAKQRFRAERVVTALCCWVISPAEDKCNSYYNPGATAGRQQLLSQ